MNRKDEIKFEILSNIDDRIIEEQTKKRHRLMQKPRYSRKKLTAWIGVAACFLILFSIGLGILLPILQKQMPVYEGMTISNASDGAQLRADIDGIVHERLLLSGGDTLPNVASGGNGNGNAYGHDKNRLPDPPDLIGENRSLYYAHKNEDIYITVHINNPDQYEILSFTLNGKKYQSYMFEEGSTSEALILKVNVGDAQGMVEYTIDAIKYVDGTEIKDVRMDGERTVRVGVYPESQPTVTLENLRFDYTEIGFDLRLTDTLSLIKQSGGSLAVELYCGDVCVETKDILLEEASTAVRFSGLTAGEQYRLRIVAEYDALDGLGFGAYLLYEETLYAKSAVAFTDLELRDDTDIFFDVEIPTEGNLSIQRIELLCGGLVERTASGDVRAFEDLPLGEHVVKVTYTYGAEGKTGYAYSDAVTVSTLGGIDRVVKAGIVSKNWTPDYEQIYNETTHDYRSHFGIDIRPTTSDTGVYAAFGGIVKEVSAGTVVLISFDGSVELSYQSLGLVEVAAGDRVTGGQKLGTVGKSLDYESAETAHLHLELWVNGERKNPTLYFGS